MTWASIQQFLRIALYTGGGMIFGEAFMDGELVQGAIGGLLSIGAFVWWLVWERNTEHLPK